MPESPISSKPLEPEKMLNGLRYAKGLLEASQTLHQSDRDWCVREGESTEYADGKIADETVAVTALEQAIKALTVLTDKRFAFVGGPESSFDGQCSMYEPGKPPVHGLADNPIEALLKAHEILYPPSTPSIDGKEDTHV